MNPPSPEKFADLHLHTNFSDGTYSPGQLIREASKRKISCISVVDHDTVGGISASLEIGSAEGVEVITGIEVSAEYDGSEAHILGYLIDHTDKILLEKLEQLKKNRIERIYKITDKLKGLGINLNPESVFKISTLGTVGRLHVARAMVKEGLSGSVSEVFRKYLGDKGPAYVCGFRFSVKEAIALIRESGGMPVLAHPYTLDKDESIPEFIGYGLKGIEVYYPEHSVSMTKFYLGIAEKFNLLVTGGSDCHGDAKPEVKIGSVKVPYELVEKLKQAKEG